jgi:hypothetical protein
MGLLNDWNLQDSIPFAVALLLIPVLDLCLCDKIPNIINLWEKRFTLAQSFKGFSAMVLNHSTPICPVLWRF